MNENTMSIGSIFSGKPDFVNEEGVKWWKERLLTEYARNEDREGTTLDAHCFAIETPTGYQTRVLVMGGKIVYESQSMETIGARIDWLKVVERDQEKQSKAGSHLRGDRRTSDRRTKRGMPASPKLGR